MSRRRTATLAIDAVGAKYGGAATIVTAVVDAAVSCDSVRRIALFTSPKALWSFILPDSEKLEVIEPAWAERGRAARLAWQLGGLPEAVPRTGAGALLCLSGGGVAPQGMPCATFIQQSLPFCREALARLSASERFRMLMIRASMAASCARSALVMVQTPTMRASVAGGLGVPAERIEVIPPCATVGPLVDAEYPELASLRGAASQRRLLYVGSAAPYKNLSVVLQALRSLRPRYPNLQVFATLPGDHAVCSESGMVGLGSLSAHALAQAYSLATAVIMPSLVETVGLPMLEAASAGTPVIAADRPYAHDVCGEAALYFDPLNSGELATQIDRLLRDEALRGQLRQDGLLRARSFAAGEPYRQMVEAVVALA